jgi:hypothetical protein
MVVEYPRRRGRAILASAIVALSLPLAISAQDGAEASSALSVGPGDVRIEARDDGGYDLYVRAKPGIASILITESTKDPAMKADNFAYRAMERNDVNGGETRLLNGKPIPASSKLYSLISSTPSPDPAFGQAFRILIPPVLIYGYPWSRSGTVAVGQGTYVNIRAFERRYADYGGAFRDNPYMIAISAKPVPPPAEPATVSTAPQLQEQVVAPPPPKDDRPSSNIVELIESSPGKSLDLVLCLDTTASMEPYFDDIRKNIGPMLRQRVSGFSRFRIGVVLYKDYWPDEYITRNYPYTSDISVIEGIVKGAAVYGGGDIPEAEIEALYAAATEFEWGADRRQIIVLTDAPPHPDPRGKILFDEVAAEAKAKRIELDAVTEPTKMPSPPNPDHPEFENEMKCLASLSASGTPLRLFVLADSPVTPGAGGSAPSAEPSPTAQILLEDKVSAALSAGPKVDFLRLGAASDTSAGAPPDAAAIKGKAAEIGATHCLIVRTRVSGAFSETVSRLLDASTGLELAHDVVWRANSEGVEAVFVNGARMR